MKQKTSELSGRPLDWAVAKAAGYLEPMHPGERPRVKLWPLGEIWVDRAAVSWNPIPDVYYRSDFNPSGAWEDAGWIIDRERICFNAFLNPVEGWNACVYIDGARRHHLVGPTALVAAMRCFVHLKLGDEVDIPEELL